MQSQQGLKPLPHRKNSTYTDKQTREPHLVPLELHHVDAVEVVPDLLVRHHLVIKDVQDLLQADAVGARVGLVAL